MATHTFLRRLWAAGAILGLLAAPAMAADAASWAGVKQAIVHQLPDGTTLVGFSPEALDRAAKRPYKSSGQSASVELAESSVAVDLSATEERTVSQWVKPKGRGQLSVFDQNDTGDVGDDLQVHFTVPSGAVDRRVLITMTVYGNALSDLVVAFQPGGLVFNTDAQLQLVLGPDLVDLDVSTLTIWHEYADGTTEETSLEAHVNKGNDYLEIKAAVSGFSRYGIRRY